MAVKGKMGSADGDKQPPYKQPNPPRGKMGSAGGSVPNPPRPSPPKTPMRGIQGKQSQKSIFTPPSYKKGGRVRKTGVALVHKGEKVLGKGGKARHKRAMSKA